MSATPLAALPAQFPAQDGRYALAGPAGCLEVAVGPAAPELARAGTAIICHPHPQQGGSMSNKVVTMLARTLGESGLNVVRFNFRGVGGSEGGYDEGHGEGADLVAVADWVRAALPGDALWLAGFSFGSYVSIAHARQLAAAALISVAPPVGRWPFDALALPDCPWLIVQGEDDEVVQPQAVYDYVAQLEARPVLIRMPEAGHFFHRKLMDLRGAVRNAVRGWLPPPRAAA